MSDDFEDEAQKRQARIDLLDSPRGLSRYQQRIEGDAAIVDPAGDAVFAQDELDATAEYLNQMRTGDQLAQKAALRAQKWKGLNDVAKFNRINPPTALKGTLGGQQVVNPGGQAIQVVNWTGDDSEALPCTITLGPVEQLTTTLTIPRFRPFAIIQFGTRGFSLKAEVDIGKGCELTVGASSVTVQVALDPDPSGAVGQMRLAGMLSFYPIECEVPITRTRYNQQNILQGVGDIIEVPPFAKNVIVWRTPNTADFTLFFRDSSGTVLYSVAVAAGTVMTVPIVLSSDVTVVNLINGLGAVITDARYVFELAL